MLTTLPLPCGRMHQQARRQDDSLCLAPSGLCIVAGWHAHLDRAARARAAWAARVLGAPATRARAAWATRGVGWAAPGSLVGSHRGRLQHVSLNACEGPTPPRAPSSCALPAAGQGGGTPRRHGRTPHAPHLETVGRAEARQVRLGRAGRAGWALAQSLASAGRGGVGSLPLAATAHARQPALAWGGHDDGEGGMPGCVVGALLLPGAQAQRRQLQGAAPGDRGGDLATQV